MPRPPSPAFSDTWYGAGPMCCFPLLSLRTPQVACLHGRCACAWLLQIRAKLVDLTTLCPIVDAVHYRNSFALHHLLAGALPPTAALGLPPLEVLGLSSSGSGGGDSVVAPDDTLADVSSLQDCFMEQDRYGQTLLHVAVKSKAAGFARLFVRLRRLVADGKRTSVDECVGLACCFCVCRPTHLVAARFSASQPASLPPPPPPTGPFWLAAWYGGAVRCGVQGFGAAGTNLVPHPRPSHGCVHGGAVVQWLE